jgi:hypothetical protein
LVPAITLPRNRLVLAFAIALHLLAALFWLQDKRLRPMERPESVSILLYPAAERATHSLDRPSPSITRTRRALSEIVAPEHDVASPVAAAPRTDEDSRSVPSDKESAAPANPSPAGLSMDLIRRQARQVARAMSQGLPGLPSGTDTPWSRFRRDVEAAHFEPGIWQDSYTAPDGTIIYRKHVGGRVLCRMSGNVGGTGVVKGIDEAGSIPCPSRGEWKREP